MIQEFLNNQFFKATDDSNIEKLKKAAGELVKRINKDKQKLITLTLVGLDPEIAPNDPVVVEVQQIIVANWSTFMSSSKDTQVTIIRAVILESLNTVSKDNTNACIVWHTARHAISYFNLGRQKDLLTQFVLTIGNRIEQLSVESISFASQQQLQTTEIPAATIERTEIEPVLKAAVLSAADGGENPHNLTSDGRSWATVFATKGAKGLADVLNKAHRKQITEIKQGLASQNEQLLLLQIKTQLLWWKEAGYSSSAKLPYKSLPQGKLQITVAVDYSKMLPEIYPASADYFLSNAHSGFTDGSSKKLKIAEFLKQVIAEKEFNSTLLPAATTGDGRTSFLGFITALVNDQTTSASFSQQTGIADNTELTPNEITLWILSDLMAQKKIVKK